MEKFKWIPVTERLPEKDDEYIITDIDLTVTTCWYEIGVGFHEEIEDLDQDWKPNVLAWMPKPEHYKPEQTEV